MMLVVLGVASAAAALVDWWSVWQGRRGLEQFAKPTVMVVLIALALAIDADPAVAKPLIVLGLVAGLVGDVMLLPRVDRFLVGLGAFLVGHVLYIAALSTMDLVFIGLVGGCFAAAVLMLYLGWPVVKAVIGTPYAVPVVLYMAAVCGLVIVGTATHRWPIAIGGVLFATSDGLLGRDRFVRPAPGRRVVVHMLYHLGQAGLVVGLATVFAPHR